MISLHEGGVLPNFLFEKFRNCCDKKALLNIVAWNKFNCLALMGITFIILNIVVLNLRF